MKFPSSIRASFLLLGGIALGAALFLVGIGLWTQQRMSVAATSAFIGKDLVADVLPPPMYLIEARLVLSQGVEGSLTPAEAAKQMRRLVGEYQARVDHWTQHPPYGLQQELLGKQHAFAKKFLDKAEHTVLAKLQKGETEAAREALREAHQLYLDHRAGVDATVAAGNAFAAQSMRNFNTAMQLASTLTISGAALALALMLVLGWQVLASIERPLAACASLARRVASGDLSGAAAAPIRRHDGIGLLQGDLDRMRQQLERAVGAVRANADSVAATGAQIARGNSDQGERTRQQVRALEQTATTVEQLGSTVRENAEHALHAKQLAQAASEVAIRGGEVVGQVVQTMKGVSDSSSRIADIIGTIDGIAFQTNILALNAAVEAARAGEQGRGFAVVASEVRSLAQRSAEAAKQIKGLISDSAERVERGSELVHLAGLTMQDVVASIRRVSDTVREISAASMKQSSDVGEIGIAVSQLEQATERHTALMAESSAAAEELNKQADALQLAVSQFKLAHAEAAPEQPQRSHPTPVTQSARPSRRGRKSAPARKSLADALQ